MKYIICLLSLFLVGCGSVVTEPSRDLFDQVRKSNEAKVEAEHKADAAIHTSADARKAELHARDEARAALALAAEKTSEADRLGKEAVQLRNAEIADKITIWSWITVGFGVITGGVGVFIGIRFESKTGYVIALCGGGCVGLGAVGLLMAPHWILVVCVFVGALVIGVIGLLVWLLLRHEAAAKVMASQWQGYAQALPEDIRDRLNALSKSEQPEHLRDLITSLLEKSNPKSVDVK